MVSEKTRIGPILTQDDGLRVRESYLRLDPRTDLYIKEKWPELYIPSASPAVTAWHQAHFGTAYAYPVGPYLGVGQLPHLRRPERIPSHVLVVTGDLDPYATVADTDAFLTAVSGAASTRHLRQEGVGRLPYVERQARAVQEAIIGLLEQVS